MDDHQGGGAGYGVGVEGVPGLEGGMFLFQDGPDLVSGNDGREGGVSGGHALGGGDDIGGDAPVVDAPRGAGAAPAGHDLIVDEQDVVLITNLADDLEVTIRGGGAGQGCANHRLGDEGRHVVRVLLADGGLERAGAQQVTGWVGLFEGTAVAEGGRDMRRVDIHGLEDTAPAGDARKACHRNGVAVEGLPARDDLVLGGLAAFDPVLARQAHGVVGGVRPRAGDPDPAVVF